MQLEKALVSLRELDNFICSMNLLVILRRNLVRLEGSGIKCRGTL